MKLEETSRAKKIFFFFSRIPQCRRSHHVLCYFQDQMSSGVNFGFSDIEFKIQRTKRKQGKEYSEMSSKVV